MHWAEESFEGYLSQKRGLPEKGYAYEHDQNNYGNGMTQKPESSSKK